MFATFPKSRLEFERAFTAEEDCLGFLAKLRWPQGFVCPKFGKGDKFWATTRDRYVCGACRHQTSITAGTIFHRTKKPLSLWFRAIWYMTVHKHGGNALGLQRELGFSSYHTAWEWFHKLRQAMIRPGRDLLGGLVEVDETYVGGAHSGKTGRGAEGKVLVAMAVEDKGVGFGRIRMQRIPDASGESLIGFARGHIIAGSQIRTDGWTGYSQIGAKGFDHLVVNSKKLKDGGEDALPLCHRVISLFKRHLTHTFQGAVHFAHLDRYLEEFVFRFNRRTSRRRTLLTFRLLEGVVVHPPFPAKQIELGLGQQPQRGRRLLSRLGGGKPRQRPPSSPLAAIPGLAASLPQISP